MGRCDAEGNRAHLCAPRAEGHDQRRHLSGCRMARRCRKRQPGGGAGILFAAGAQHQRQVGESGAARADAHPHRHQRQESATAARRHECRGRCRYRPRPRFSELSQIAVRPSRVVMAAEADNAFLNGNRGAITACAIVATLMQALDTTIANVALPYMQGSVSASQDQIDWVLTSYIVAAAIMTPPTGFLAGRFGIRRLFMVSIAGFTAISMLCGMGESLDQIVLFRLMQGAFCAALVPLSQTVLFNIYPRERHGFAMALFGVGVMVGPILGPILGGWLTENYSWRWVFYINLPIGILGLIGISMFLPGTKRSEEKLDWCGFGTLSVTLGAFQVMLDRGEIKDWFSSGEIILEAVIAASALYLFLVHTFTADRPFVRPALFRDRNFTAGTIFVAIVVLTYYASLALQPPYLQTLMNYPVVTAGLVLGPRGVGTMAAMLIVGRLIGRVDTRLMLGLGLGLSAWAFSG